MTKQEQYAVMEKFFYECVRFWEHELKTDSDLDKEPYLNAIKEIPKYYPYTPNGEPFDEDVRQSFYESRMMDVYGVNWRRYA